MYFATEKEMEKLDRLAVKSGLEIRQMMELAGWHMMEVFKRLKISKKSQIAIVVGTGNKGGDGLSAARHLINNGFEVEIIIISKKISANSKHHLALLKRMKAKVTYYPRSKNKVVNILDSSDYIIDALIGYHLQGAPRGDFAELIIVMNKLGSKVISYDLPSGLEATRGICHTPCVNAIATLTLALPKKSFQSKIGKQLSGELFLADIGIPSFLYNKIKKGSRPNFEAHPNSIVSL